MMIDVIAAEARSEHDRVAHCRAGLDAMLRSGHHIELVRPAPFDMNARHFPLGQLEMFEVRGTPHRMAVQGCSDGVAVLVNVEGGGRVQQGVREAALRPGSLHLLDDGQPFALDLPDNFVHLVVRVPRALIEASLPGWRALAVFGMTTRCGPAAVFAATLRSLFAQRATLAPADFRESANAVLALLAGALRSAAREAADEASTVEHYHFERVKAFVRDRLADPELDVRQIADAMALSPRYIHRLFERSSMTLMQWITAQRLDACHRELSVPGRLKQPVYVIAQAWGFVSQAHFSRVFRARFGVSPSAVRAGQPPCRCGQAPCTQGLERGCAKIGALSDNTSPRRALRLRPKM